MIVAGVDVGSATSKAVVMCDNNIISWSIIPTGPDSEEIAKCVLNLAVNDAGLSYDRVEYVVGTGYGRINISFAQANITEISCHAKGAVWVHPQTRTILDMGGQDCKAIRCDETGKVLNFFMNDKRAAGTGRYLERIARLLEVSLDDFGPLSLKIVDKPATISSYCTVFAENDVIMLLREGKHLNDILAGACEAVTIRVCSLLQRVSIAPALMITGGIAKNIGVVQRIEKKLNTKVAIELDPQIIGALGAALFAKNRLMKQRLR